MNYNSHKNLRITDRTSWYGVDKEAKNRRRTFIDFDVAVRIAWGLSALVALGILPYFTWRLFMKRKKKENGADQ